MLVDEFCRLGAPRIDERRYGHALADRRHPTWPIRCGGEAPIRGLGIGAHHQEIVGAVDVGHRDGERVAEHQTGRHMFGHLVHRACREDIAGTERLHEWPHVERARQTMHVGIPQVHADGIGSVLGLDRDESAFDLGERLIPGDARPDIATTDLRLTQTIRGPRGVRQGSNLSGQMNPLEKTSSRSPESG